MSQTLTLERLWKETWVAEGEESQVWELFSQSYWKKRRSEELEGSEYPLYTMYQEQTPPRKIHAKMLVPEQLVTQKFASGKRRNVHPQAMNHKGKTNRSWSTDVYEDCTTPNQEGFLKVVNKTNPDHYDVELIVTWDSITEGTSWQDGEDDWNHFSSTSNGWTCKCHL